MIEESAQHQLENAAGGLPDSRKNEKNCLLILPYFGKFNRYFPLFLKSCGKNPGVHWLLITDNQKAYDYPDNVHVVRKRFQQLKEEIAALFDFEICLQAPYKLCDYRPAYGLIFQKELAGYAYWGHCDCDLIFGDLDHLLLPLLQEGHDKLFAAGHLTLYRNTEENRYRFQHAYKGACLYKKVFTTEEFCCFDEDYQGDNIQSIFVEEGARLYTENMSICPAMWLSQFYMVPYCGHEKRFVPQPFERALYVWNDGKMERTTLEEGRLRTRGYLYMHFQARAMRFSPRLLAWEGAIRIYPNAFGRLRRYPVSLVEWRRLSGYTLNLFWFKHKWRNFKIKVNDWKKQHRRRNG